MSRKPPAAQYDPALHGPLPDASDEPVGQKAPPVHGPDSTESPVAPQYEPGVHCLIMTDWVGQKLPMVQTPETADKPAVAQ